MLDSHIEKEIFRKTFQRLTFTPCIQIYTLCDLAFSKEFFDDCGVEPTENVSIDDCVRYRRRYKRILQRLCIEKDLDLKAVELLAKPKIYDKFMLESQIRLYNEFAETIGYAPIKNILPIPLIKDAAFLDGATPDYDTIAKHYPYYPFEDRNGANLIECILLLTIRFTLQKRGLDTLNKKVETTKDRRRVVKMVNDLIANMKSEKMFSLYVHIVYDILEETIEPIYRQREDKSLRLVWLPDNLKGRKDAVSAFESYRNKVFHARQVEYTSWQLNDKILSENTPETSEAYNSIFDFYTIDAIALELLPLTFHALMGSKKIEQIYENENMKKIAREYAQVIRKFINQAIAETESILNKLYIENL